MNVVLSNNEIILISMIFATIVMFIIKLFKDVYYKCLFKRWIKRKQYIKQLATNDDIPTILINIDNEPNRISPAINNNGLIVDGKLYNDKNSLFFEEDKRMYIIGKKENYLIALVGGTIGKK